MNRILISAAALLAASLSTVTAVAPGYAATPDSVAVAYGDLDLSQAIDRQQLDERLDDAARQVCRADTAFSIFARAQERDCRAATLDRAAEQIPFPDSATD